MTIKSFKCIEIINNTMHKVLQITSVQKIFSN